MGSKRSCVAVTIVLTARRSFQFPNADDSQPKALCVLPNTAHAQPKALDVLPERQ